VPTHIWRTGVGYEEENYQRDFHDPLSCVEPCIHNTSIYRQTRAQTAPALNGPAKTGHTKGPHLTEPPLEYRRDGAISPSNRCATRGTIAARPTNGRRPRVGGKTRRPRRGDKTRRPASGFHSTNAPAGHQDCHDPSRQRRRPTKAGNMDRQMGRPGQGSSNRVQRLRDY